MAQVQLKRDSGYADRLRAYHVVLDGKKTMKIVNGGNIDISVPPGSHELFIMIDWCRSNKVNFSIAEGEVKAFDCGSSLRGIKIFLAIVYATFLKNNYLWLSESVIKPPGA